MRKLLGVLAVVAFAAILGAGAPADKSTTYDVTADSIERRSRPLFCTCYFGPSANEHMCQFDIVYKFRKGSHWGNVDISDQIVWASGDLGGEWHKKPGPGMPLAWVNVTFDKASSKEQRDAIGKVLGVVFPVKWGKFSAREDSISFVDAGKVAEAKMASGMGEVHLDKAMGTDKTTPSVIKNLQYWFTNSTDGFVLACSKHHFDGGEARISEDHKNGFTIAWTVKGKIPAEKVASR